MRHVYDIPLLFVCPLYGHVCATIFMYVRVASNAVRVYYCILYGRTRCTATQFQPNYVWLRNDREMFVVVDNVLYHDNTI